MSHREKQRFFRHAEQLQLPFLGLTDSNGLYQIPKWSELISFLPTVLWRKDPEVLLEARRWVQGKILHAEKEVPKDRMREIYVRNLLCYLPFFSPEKGEEIEVPFGGLGRFIWYEIEPLELTPKELGSPLMAYGLIPKDKKNHPVLLFKGTTYPADEGLYLGVLTDINPYGMVGSLAFHGAAKGRIESWLKKHTREGQKAEVIGTSLGGAFSLLTASYQPEYVGKVYAFNSPAATYDEIAAWERGEVKPEVNIYLQEGDPIASFVGSRFAHDWNVYRVYAPGSSILQTHASAYTAHPESFAIKEDVDALNAGVSRRAWPFIQHLFLFPIFLIGVAFLAFKVIILKVCLFAKGNLSRRAR